MPDPLIHLICGSAGAGKTTYAQELTKPIGAVGFSIDEWMTRLFWKDSPQPLEPSWSMERVERCLAQIWSTASRVAGVLGLMNLYRLMHPARVMIPIWYFGMLLFSVLVGYTVSRFYSEPLNRRLRARGMGRRGETLAATPRTSD